MAFARWDSFHDLLALQDRLEQLSGEHAPGWTPPVDSYETDAGYVITAEVPGLSRDDILIQLRNGQLVIEGDRSTGADG